jgi:hypothetical protein
MTLDEILQSHATVYAGYPESYQDIAAAAAERTATVIHDRPQADAYIQRLQASLVSLEQDYSHLVEQVRAVLTDVYHAYTTGTPVTPHEEHDDDGTDMDDCPWCLTQRVLRGEHPDEDDYETPETPAPAVTPPPAGAGHLAGSAVPPTAEPATHEAVV